mgnify:CR=1 FL=1
MTTSIWKMTNKRKIDRRRAELAAGLTAERDSQSLIDVLDGDTNQLSVVNHRMTTSAVKVVQTRQTDQKICLDPPTA